jgi:hypothetical protein
MADLLNVMKVYLMCYFSLRWRMGGKLKTWVLFQCFNIHCSYHLQGERGKRRMQLNTEAHCEGYTPDYPL